MWACVPPHVRLLTLYSTSHDNGFAPPVVLLWYVDVITVATSQWGYVRMCPSPCVLVSNVAAHEYPAMLQCIHMSMTP